ncbi:phosphodiester glycosidase family protein [Alkaliphilus serpentinus]|nr:phosphodiester glycosidase family protein [Alkaliphilus serpentinus]
MYRKNKSSISLLIVLLIFLSLTSGVVASEPLVNEVTTKKLSRGVTQQHILRFNKDGWLNANVLYVDLSDESTELKVLQSSKGLTTKETLSSMVGREENVVAAINGDFFYNLIPDSPMGTIIRDGEMISSPVIAENFANLYVNNQGLAFADYWDFNLHITTDKGSTIKLAAINKILWNYHDLLLIDRNWGAMSVGVSEANPNMVEVVVMDDKVTEIRDKQPAVEIPENGYILLATGPKRQELLALEVGSEIALHTEISPNFKEINTAIGGGTLLVKDGKVVTEFTQNVAGNQPRTAVGISKDRKQLIMITVDGRNQSFKGVSGQQLANLLIELGSYEGIMMDGGGSSTMITRALGTSQTSVINYPSDGTERRIINGLAAISTAAPGPIMGLTTSTLDERVYLGATRSIDIGGYDENFNPVNIDLEKVNYSVTKGMGRVENHIFYPEAAGVAEVTIEYMGLTSQMAFEVLENLSHIVISPRTLRLNNNRSYEFKVLGVNQSGYSIPIEGRDITWKDSNSLGSFNEKGVYSTGIKNGETIIEAAFAGNTINSIVVIGNEKLILEGFEKSIGQYLGYPLEVTGSIQQSKEAYKGNHSIMLEYDFTTTEATRAAYIAFNDGGISIANKPEKLGVWANAFEKAPHRIRGRIMDGKGDYHNIDFASTIDWTGWKYIEAAIPTGITYPILIDRLYVVETNPQQQNTGKILFDELQAIYSIPFTMTDSLEYPSIVDSIEREPEEAGVKLLIHPGHQYSKETLLDRIVNNRIASIVEKDYSYGIFTGGIKGDAKTKTSKTLLTPNGSYYSMAMEKSLVLFMDNSNGGLRQTNYDQWPWFLKELKETKEENIIVVLPKAADKSFTDPLELKLFMKSLTDLAETGKGVFVFSSGEKIETKLIDGVRYISLGTNTFTTEKQPTKDYTYIELNITDEDVTYQIKPLF